MSAKLKIFLLSIPLVVLFSVGVMFRSTTTLRAGPGCSPDNLSGVFQNDLAAVFEGRSLKIPEIGLAEAKDNPVLGVATPSDRWVEVDLSEQKLRAWDGNTLFLETAVSTGLPGTPTPTGEFRVWVKLKATKMEGGQGRYYYYLPNVPFVMYFENDAVPGWRGYGLHGTYWHNDFGTPRSHGCVNLPTPIAEKIYYWASPELPQNKSSVFASAENPGIRVIIHE